MPYLTEPNLDEAISFARGYAYKHWCAPGNDMGQIESAAVQGAWLAFERYKAGKSKWCTYLHNMVEWHIRKGLRSKHDKATRAGLLAPIEAAELVVCEVDQNLSLDIQRALQSLEPNERDIIVALHIQGYTVQQAIKALDQRYTPVQLQDIQQAALAKMRAVLA